MGKKKKKKSGKVKLHPLEAELQHALAVMDLEARLLEEAADTQERNVNQERAHIEQLKVDISQRKAARATVHVDPEEMAKLREQTERDLARIKVLTEQNAQLDRLNEATHDAFVKRSYRICKDKACLEREFKAFFAQRRAFVDAFQRKYQFTARSDPKEEGFGRALLSDAAAVAFDNEQRLFAVQGHRDALRSEIATLEARRRAVLQRQAGSAVGREAYVPVKQPRSIVPVLVEALHMSRADACAVQDLLGVLAELVAASPMATALSLCPPSFVISLVRHFEDDAGVVAECCHLMRRLGRLRPSYLVQAVQDGAAPTFLSLLLRHWARARRVRHELIAILHSLAVVSTAAASGSPPAAAAAARDEQRSGASATVRNASGRRSSSPGHHHTGTSTYGASRRPEHDGRDGLPSVAAPAPPPQDLRQQASPVVPAPNPRLAASASAPSLPTAIMSIGRSARTAATQQLQQPPEGLATVPRGFAAQASAGNSATPVPAHLLGGHAHASRELARSQTRALELSSGLGHSVDHDHGAMGTAASTLAQISVQPVVPDPATLQVSPPPARKHSRSSSMLPAATGGNANSGHAARLPSFRSGSGTPSTATAVAAPLGHSTGRSTGSRSRGADKPAGSVTLDDSTVLLLHQARAAPWNVKHAQRMVAAAAAAGTTAMFAGVEEEAQLLSHDASADTVRAIGRAASEAVIRRAGVHPQTLQWARDPLSSLAKRDSSPPRGGQARKKHFPVSSQPVASTDSRTSRHLGTQTVQQEGSGPVGQQHFPAPTPADSSDVLTATTAVRRVSRWEAMLSGAESDGGRSSAATTAAHPAGDEHADREDADSMADADASAGGTIIVSKLGAELRRREAQAELERRARAEAELEQQRGGSGAVRATSPTHSRGPSRKGRDHRRGMSSASLEEGAGTSFVEMHGPPSLPEGVAPSWNPLMPGESLLAQRRHAAISTVSMTTGAEQASGLGMTAAVSSIALLSPILPSARHHSPAGGEGGSAAAHTAPRRRASDSDHDDESDDAQASRRRGQHAAKNPRAPSRSLSQADDADGIDEDEHDAAPHLGKPGTARDHLDSVFSPTRAALAQSLRAARIAESGSEWALSEHVLVDIKAVMPILLAVLHCFAPAVDTVVAAYRLLRGIAPENTNDGPFRAYWGEICDISIRMLRRYAHHPDTTLSVVEALLQLGACSNPDGDTEAELGTAVAACALAHPHHTELQKRAVSMLTRFGQGVPADLRRCLRELHHLRVFTMQHPVLGHRVACFSKTKA